MSISIQILTASDDAKLIAFLDQTSVGKGTVLAYHYPFFRDALTNTGVGDPLYLGALKDNKLIGVLPGFIKTSEDGTVYNSLPFFGPNGGVQCQEANNDCHVPLFSFLMDYLDTNFDMLSAAIYSPFMPGTEQYYESLQAPIVVDKFTHFIDMENHTLPGVRRRDINTARKRNVTILDNLSHDDMEKLFEIYKTNCNDYGIDLKPWSLFEYFLENQNSERLLISAAEYEGEMIAGLITLYSKDVASYYIPCQKHENRSLQPVPFLIDHHMAKTRATGVRFWNWESSPSMDSGVAAFKKRWGSLDGTYKVHVIPFKPDSVFAEFGTEKIQQNYPWFFVYPFNRIK
jgi:hypothetical protein